MSKLLVVFGATGNQGGSVIKQVINDPFLVNEYHVRAVTRDISKPSAQALQQTGKVQVVQGDADDVSSLKRVLEGAHTVFSTTATIYDERLEERELSQGKEIANAAVAVGAQYLIYSTLFHIARVSGGKYDKGRHFDCKAEVEDYIRTLPIKSSFFAAGCFMQNFSSIMKPFPVGDGTYALANIVAPYTELPLINVEEAGKFVATILANPDEFEGKVLAGATKTYTMEEIAQIMSKSSGKTVIYKQLPEEVFRNFLPSTMADYLVHMLLYIQDFGYYGPQTKELVTQTAANARGKLTTLEEYFAEHPLNLS
ncbi:NmrA family protein [Schizosaccharomyces cryophilus OY26]|uniref:NmrA family protein n=1 Tax=Schizosaccharomyces cryophilus (strain OY26 / ATCC MYA-4695 / CBS 11777 / NBRC 106824 / NRRL Y48691) TaxID=653667 RepID=S9XFX0_SCHCR|nr:NmrA family protein [Schizosaccharomyces cryophilus OY26]EPY52531.1 NmrA family protein [Schizosaccharomyces cryophilus OY26]